ncbi:MAG TPA: hypothetical protein VHX44_06215, partial [Planctomycetota bacterium]|nr:hypothetical protein [Planctomycetota bacterium]
DVFFEVIPRVGMHIEHVLLAEIGRQVAQLLVALPLAEPREHASADLLIGPQGRSAGLGVEADRFVDRRMVVVARDDLPFLAHVENGSHRIDRFRSVPDHIAKAVDGIDTLLVDISQHSVECRHVAMDVADDRDAPHADG